MDSFIQQIFLERQLKKKWGGSPEPRQNGKSWSCVCSSHGGELANRAPGQAVSTSSSGWHGMPREDKPARKSQSAHGCRHKHEEGRPPRSRLPLHSPRASGHGRPGCMFSAGRTPDHRAPTNPAITAASASLRTIKCACPVAKTSEQALPGSGSAMQCLSDLGQVLSNGQDSPSSKPWQQHQPECVAVVSKPCEATVNASCTLPSFGRQSFAPSKCRVEQSRDYGDKGTGRWG